MRLTVWFDESDPRHKVALACSEAENGPEVTKLCERLQYSRRICGHKYVPSEAGIQVINPAGDIVYRFFTDRELSAAELAEALDTIGV